MDMANPEEDEEEPPFQRCMGVIDECPDKGVIYCNEKISPTQQMCPSCVARAELEHACGF